MQIKLAPGAIAPKRATDGSAGYDLHLLHKTTLTGFGRYSMAQTGVHVAIPEGYVGLVFPRSSAAIKRGITLKNSVGVIDSDYRGEIKLALQTRHPHAPVELERGERIAQLVIVPAHTPELEVVDELPETARAEGGFGSTGVA